MNDRKQIRVMTNNVKRDVRIADRADLMLANYDRYLPDVLGLQECDPLAYETVVDPLAAGRFAVAGTVTDTNGEYSRTPILYLKEKYDLLEQKSDFFRDRYTNSKTYSFVVLRDRETGKTFALINVHFAIIIGSYPKEIGTDAEVGNQWRIGNAKQVVELTKALAQKYGNIPMFLTGDFNSTARHEPYRILTEFFADSLTVASDFRSKPTATYHLVGEAPDVNGLPVDFIFVTKGNTEVLRCEIISDEDMINSTDHCALITDLKI